MVTASASGAVNGSISGTVTDAESHVPIQGVFACAFSEGPGEFEEECDQTNLAGEYAIPGIPAGEYGVAFWPEGLNYLFQFYDGRTREEEPDLVTVVAGANTPGINAELQRGGEISGTIASLQGAAPIEEVEVCAFAEDVFGGCAFTDSAGKYTIDGLAADEYAVEFWPGWTEQNFLTQFFDHKDRFSEANLVTVGAGSHVAEVDADLKPAAMVSGTVYSAASGAPLREILVCSVSVASGKLTACNETSGSGQYSLFGLASGAYKIAFSLEFREFFPGEPPELDGFPTQFYNGKTTLAAADTLNLTAPSATSGIDAHLGTPPVIAPIASLVLPPVSPTHRRRPLKCKKHFRKVKEKGKVHCVRVHRKRRPGSTGRETREVPSRLLTNLG